MASGRTPRACAGAAGAVRLPLTLAASKTLGIQQASTGQIKASVVHARTSRSQTRASHSIVRSAPLLLTKFQARGRRRRIEWPPNSQEARSC